MTCIWCCTTAGGHVLFYSYTYHQLLCGHLRSQLQPRHINNLWTSNQSINQWNPREYNCMYFQYLVTQPPTESLETADSFMTRLGHWTSLSDFLILCIFMGTIATTAIDLSTIKKILVDMLRRVLYQDLEHSWGHK